MSVLQRNPHQPTLHAQYPLVKYSYAETSSDQDGPISWTHVQSNELNTIFETEPVQQKLRLRVVRAREQLVGLRQSSIYRDADLVIGRH
jgi:hypothetical protein